MIQQIFVRFIYLDFGSITSMLHIASKVVGWTSHGADVESSNHLAVDKRANATLLVLCRNSDLNGILTSIWEAEDRFNDKYRYPWVFLNEEPFTEEFKKQGFCRRYLTSSSGVSILTGAPVEFGVIARDHWYQPPWIDDDKAMEMRQMPTRILRCKVHRYRNMCRFNSGVSRSRGGNMMCTSLAQCCAAVFLF